MQRTEEWRNLEDVHGCALDSSDEARGERGIEEGQEGEPREWPAADPIEEACQPEQCERRRGVQQPSGHSCFCRFGPACERLRRPFVNRFCRKRELFAQI